LKPAAVNSLSATLPAFLTPEPLTTLTVTLSVSSAFTIGFFGGVKFCKLFGDERPVGPLRMTRFAVRRIRGPTGSSTFDLAGIEIAERVRERGELAVLQGLVVARLLNALFKQVVDLEDVAAGLVDRGLAQRP